jgi:hypothetical protein
MSVSAGCVIVGWRCVCCMVCEHRCEELPATFEHVQLASAYAGPQQLCGHQNHDGHCSENEAAAAGLSPVICG